MQDENEMIETILSSDDNDFLTVSEKVKTETEEKLNNPYYPRADEEDLNYVYTGVEENEDSEEFDYSDDNENTNNQNNTVNNQEYVDNSENFDYKQAYKNLLSPIRAIGKEIPISNAEELRELASKGIDYTKKMQTLKPMRKMVEMIESNNLTKDDINMLIDLKKGNKKVLNNMAKQYNVDPLDVNTNDLADYKNYEPTEDQITYNDSKEFIENSAYREELKNLVYNRWDSNSSATLMFNPNLLQGMSEEMEMNRFDIIQTEVERLKAVGKDNGKSDYQLYYECAEQFENELEKRGLPRDMKLPDNIKELYSMYMNNPEQFNNMLHAQQQQYMQPQQQYYQQPQVTNDKYRATPVKGRTSNTGTSSVSVTDMLNMSDEEFMRLNDLSRFR